VADYITVTGHKDLERHMTFDANKIHHIIPSKREYAQVAQAILNGSTIVDPRFCAADEIILCCLNQDDIHIGKYYASILSAKVSEVRTFDELIGQLEKKTNVSCAIFMPVNLFTLDRINRIHESTSHTVPRLRIGFFPCGNSELLLHMISKDLYYNFVEYEDKLSLLRILNKKAPEYSAMSKLTIFNQDTATLENVKKYFDSHFCRVGSFLGHGRDDLFWLANLNVICGANSSETSTLENNPACHYCGECFEPSSKRILAHDIPIENLFLFSCNSVKPRVSMFSKKYTILYGFLEGYARSVIGTLTTAQGIEPLNMYYIRLLECGFSLGEVVSILNMVNENYSISHPWNFLLIGNPGITMGNQSSIYEAVYDITYQEKISISIDTSGYKMIRIYFINFGKEDFDSYLEYSRFIVSDNDFVLKMYKLFGFNERGWYLDLFSCEDIPPMNFEISFLTIDFSIFSPASFLKQASDFNLRINNKVDQLNTLLQNRIRKIQKNYQGINSSYANNESTLYSQVIQLRENVIRQSTMIIESLVAKAHATGFRWEEFCYENGYKIDSSYQLSFRQCPLCGSESFYAKYTHPHYHEYARMHCYCGRCGILSDEPFELNEKIAVSIDCLDYKCNESNTVKIKIKSRMEHSDPCIVGFSVLWGQDYGFTYTDNVQVLRLKKDDTAYVEGNVICGSLVLPHSHPLKIYVMINGQLFSYRYNLWFK